MLPAIAESTRAKPNFTAAAIGTEIKQPRPGLSITDGDPRIEGNRLVGGNIDEVAREIHIGSIAVQHGLAASNGRAICQCAVCTAYRIIRIRCETISVR